MAFYIIIKKLDETESYADYSFADEAGEGKLRLDKTTNEVQELLVASKDGSGKRFQRAAMKVLQHWGKGELPEVTCWAS